MEEVSVNGKPIPERFSLVKGMVLLGAAMLVGFVSAYELVENAGGLFSFDDVMQVSSLKARAAGDAPTTSLPGVTSFNTNASTSQTTDVPQNTTGNVTEYLNTTTVPPITVAPCFAQQYQINQICDVTGFVNTSYGEDVTLENLGHMIFKTELIDRLDDKCDPGEWCESDDWPLVADSNDYLDFCYLSQCLLDNLTPDCTDKRRSLVVRTLSLLCNAVDASYNITDQCFLAIRKMTHVSVALLDMNDVTGDEICADVTDSSNCSATCNQMSRGLYCMCDICEHQTDIYQHFRDWVWYFQDGVVPATTCDVTNDTLCSFLTSPEESWFDNFWNKLQTVEVSDVIDAKVLTAMIISGIIMVAGIGLSVWACVKKGPGLKRYARNKIEYTRVTGDEDEFEDA